MTVPEVADRVEEFGALVERQRRVVEQLERDASDATSAKIIFDSLRVSLSLHMDDWHRLKGPVEAKGPETPVAARIPETAAADTHDCEPGLTKTSESALKPKPIFDIVPGVALRGRRHLMPVKSVFLKVITPSDDDANQEQQDETPDVPAASVGDETHDQADTFVFRPLTEQERNEFVNSLSAKAKKTLADLMGEQSPSKTTAA